MSMPVKLTEIVGALNIQNDDVAHYLDRQTGEIEMVTSEELRAVERGAAIEEFPEWQQGQIKLAEAILDDAAGQYIKLPTQFDVHEYKIMENFSRSYPDEQISDELCYAIRGGGAFRRFKNKIHQYEIAEEWYKYRDVSLEAIDRHWCEANKISFI